MNIGVFCSASNSIDAKYFPIAEFLGRTIAEKQHTMVYGGSDFGLMKTVSETVKNLGGKVIGFISNTLAQYASKNIDCCCISQNLQDRKQDYISNADIFVALPGGIGTLDEIMSVIASNDIKEHDKKVILVNVDGFYDKLLDLFNIMKEGKFITHTMSNQIIIINNIEDINQYI